MGVGTTLEPSAARLFEPPDLGREGGPTLERSILVLWEKLAVHGWAGCPVCDAPLRSGTPCDRCGSELS